ncbi:hypothetical protein B0H67DRAFT_597472 [Lasiosphaeris hirsuta]|uniref:Alternative oxidase n=1 Tax=Lasiosphaeris hirsuta TaxID=260670 RepID=A0AA40BCA6_9PEZI|nr:hypothetical protein B0H67DRAFT_597472 [Lasiosphaeris hirsuta]
MFGSPRVFQIVKIAAPFLLAVWFLGYVISYKSAYNGVVRQFKDERDLFLSDFLEHEVDGSLDGRGIAELCAGKRWSPGLMLSCEPPSGGIGQVKNAHLNCIRFAIEMGAELVTPRIIKRSEKDIKVVKPHNGNGPYKGEPLDYFFDFAHFNQTMSKFCPQMKIHRSMDDLYQVPSVLNGYETNLEKLHTQIVNGSVITNVTVWSGQLKSFVDEVSPPAKRTHPVRFHLDVTNWAFPTSAHNPTFVQHFGRILRIREDARRVSASALYNMQKRFQLQLDPRHGLKSDTFAGLHLRTERDAEHVFPSFEDQAAYLLDYVTSSKARVVFMATGADESNVTAFAERAADFDVTVLLKKDLLQEEDLNVLKGFTWDQRALVDYEIMLRAGLIAGPSQSSFAWNIALRRNYAAGASEGTLQVNTSAHIQWQDGHSTIFGDSEMGPVFRETVWP